MTVRITVILEDMAWKTCIPNPITYTRTIIRPLLPKRGGLTVLLSNDAAVQALNRQFRASDKPTNVLSFPGINQKTYLGDIILALETIEAEAKQHKKTFLQHFTHLIVHGTLHLLGYDHVIKHDAEIMEQREREYLYRLGIPDPYQ
jgi:probable rRNA maturation factor